MTESEEKKEARAEKKQAIHAHIKKRRRRRRIIILMIVLAVVLFFLGYWIWLFYLREDDPIERSKYGVGDSCAIYLYMCGSNLESKQGLAGKNIDELLKADIPENMNIIIQTGGAAKWRSHKIPHDKLGRYVVKNKKLKKVEELPSASMGEPETLTGFLRFCEEQYQADRQVLVFWDHGGSAAEGCCYDENYNNDYLSRTDLKQALADAGLKKKFDMVVFDTCFMGSVETAALMKDYAYYMVASQNIIPAGGMNYESLAGSFFKNEDEDYGRILCDSFMEKCRKKEVDTEVQLSLYQLDRAKRMGEEIEAASENIQVKQSIAERLEDIGKDENEVDSSDNIANSTVVHAAVNAAVMRSSDEVNVVDLTTFFNDAFGSIDAMSYHKRIAKARDDMIRYQVHGEAVKNTGVSIYYPVEYNRNQLEEYIGDGIFPNYAQVLLDVYKDVPEEPVAYEDSGHVSEDGCFEITLTPESRQYLKSVSYMLWKEGELLGENRLLGEAAIDIYDYDDEMDADSEHYDADSQESSLDEDEHDTSEGAAGMTFHSNFRGEWPAFVGGHINSGSADSDTSDGEDEKGEDEFLYTSVTQKKAAAYYTAPILLNDEKTEITFYREDEDDEKGPVFSSLIVGGEYDELGLPNRTHTVLEQGNRVKLLTPEDDSGDELAAGWQITIDEKEPEVRMRALPEGRYIYRFVAEDIWGKTLRSDACVFEVDGAGKVQAE